MRPLIQAICAPVLGLKVGETSGPRKLVMRRARLPLTSAIQISGSPVARGGVGDLLAVGRPGGREVGAAAAAEVDHAAQQQRVHADLEAFAAERREGEAACCPGEMRGEIEMVPRWVMACWLAPS